MKELSLHLTLPIGSFWENEAIGVYVYCDTYSGHSYNSTDYDESPLVQVQRSESSLII